MNKYKRHYYKLYLKAIWDTLIKAINDRHGFEIGIGIVVLTVIGFIVSYITGNPLISIRTFIY